MFCIILPLQCDALMNALLKLRSEDHSAKSIVVSQFTSLLTLLEIPLRYCINTNPTVVVSLYLQKLMDRCDFSKSIGQTNTHLNSVESESPKNYVCPGYL